LDEFAELPLKPFCGVQEKGKDHFKEPEKIAQTIQHAIVLTARKFTCLVEMLLR
jgi:hypothetical protein